MKYSQCIAESVTYLHPDKICDQISDLLLDEYLKQDPLSRVAIETAGGHGYVALFGEVTSKGDVDHTQLVADYYHKITGNTINVTSHITTQSSEIAQGVDTGGAGDQGIMIGYACNENSVYLPQEFYLARQLLNGFHVDGKSQVSIQDDKISSIVLSVQGKTNKQLLEHISTFDLDIEPENIYANNTGSFNVGGFDADSGCTGRKIVVDAYGPRVPVGGGAFSGKDATKVDRGAAYMARWVALKLLMQSDANQVLVKIGYVIGKAEPVIQTALIDGIETKFDYDCRPQAIIERFGLRKPIYLDLAKNGHFGRPSILPWETI